MAIDDEETQQRMEAFGEALRGADEDYWEEFRMWESVCGG